MIDLFTAGSWEESASCRRRGTRTRPSSSGCSTCCCRGTWSRPPCPCPWTRSAQSFQPSPSDRQSTYEESLFKTLLFCVYDNVTFVPGEKFVFLGLRTVVQGNRGDGPLLLTRLQLVLHHEGDSFDVDHVVFGCVDSPGAFRTLVRSIVLERLRQDTRSRRHVLVAFWKIFNNQWLHTLIFNVYGWKKNFYDQLLFIFQKQTWLLS